MYIGIIGNMTGTKTRSNPEYSGALMSIRKADIKSIFSRKHTESTTLRSR